MFIVCWVKFFGSESIGVYILERRLMVVAFDTMTSTDPSIMHWIWHRPGLGHGLHTLIVSNAYTLTELAWPRSHVIGKAVFHFNRHNVPLLGRSKAKWHRTKAGWRSTKAIIVRCRPRIGNSRSINSTPRPLARTEWALLVYT